MKKHDNLLILLPVKLDKKLQYTDNKFDDDDDDDDDDDNKNNSKHKRITKITAKTTSCSELHTFVIRSHVLSKRL